MQCIFEIVRWRGVACRIERHRYTDDDTGNDGVDAGFQDTHPDAHANQHVSCSAGHTHQIEHDEASHPDVGQDQRGQRQLGRVEQRDNDNCTEAVDDRQSQQKDLQRGRRPRSQ